MSDQDSAAPDPSVLREASPPTPGAGGTTLRPSNARASTSGGSVLVPATGVASAEPRVARYSLGEPPAIDAGLLGAIRESIATSPAEVLRLLYRSDRLSEVATVTEPFDAFVRRREHARRYVDNFAESVGTTAQAAAAVLRSTTWPELRRLTADTYQAWLGEQSSRRGLALRRALEDLTRTKLANDNRLDLDEQLTLREFGLERGLDRVTIDAVFDAVVAENPSWTREFPQPMVRRSSSDARPTIRTLGDLANIADNDLDLALDDVSQSLVSDKLGMWVSTQREGHLPLEDHAVTLATAALELGNTRLDAERIDALRRVLALRFLWHSGFRKLAIESGPKTSALVSSIEQLVAVADAHPNGAEHALAPALRTGTLSAWLEHFQPDLTTEITTAQSAESAFSIGGVAGTVVVQRVHQLLWALGMRSVRTSTGERVVPEQAGDRATYPQLLNLSRRQLLGDWLEATASIVLAKVTAASVAIHDIAAHQCLWAHGEQGLLLGSGEWLSSRRPEAIEAELLSSRELLTAFGVHAKSGLVAAWCAASGDPASGVNLESFTHDADLIAGHRAAWALGATRSVVLQSRLGPVRFDTLEAVSAVAPELVEGLQALDERRLVRLWAQQLQSRDEAESDPVELLLDIGDSTMRLDDLTPIQIASGGTFGGVGVPIVEAFASVIAAANDRVSMVAPSGVEPAIDASVRSGALARLARRVDLSRHQRVAEYAASFDDEALQVQAYLWGFGFEVLLLEKPGQTVAFRSVSGLLEVEDLRPFIAAVTKALDSGALEAWVGEGQKREALRALRTADPDADPVYDSKLDALEETILAMHDTDGDSIMRSFTLGRFTHAHRGVCALQLLGAKPASVVLPEHAAYGPVLPSDLTVAEVAFKVSAPNQIPAILALRDANAAEGGGASYSGPVTNTDDAQVLQYARPHTIAIAGNATSVSLEIVSVSAGESEALVPLRLDLDVLADPAIVRAAATRAALYLFVPALVGHLLFRDAIDATQADGESGWVWFLFLATAATWSLGKYITTTRHGAIRTLYALDTGLAGPNRWLVAWALAAGAALSSLIVGDVDAYLIGVSLTPGGTIALCQSVGVGACVASFGLFRHSKLGAFCLLSAGVAVFVAWQVAPQVSSVSW